MPDPFIVVDRLAGAAKPAVQRPNPNLSALDVSPAEREFLGQLLDMVGEVEQIANETGEVNEVEQLLWLEVFGSARRFG